MSSITVADDVETEMGNDRGRPAIGQPPADRVYAPYVEPPDHGNDNGLPAGMHLNPKAFNQDWTPPDDVDHRY